MAGMLPGVETARKRRIHYHHQSLTSIGSAHNFRHSYFSLTSCSSSAAYYSENDEKLGDLAREAKQRLDQRLRPQAKSLFSKRNMSDLREEGRSEKKERKLRTQMHGSEYKMKKNKNGGEEGGLCAVCLEECRVGQNVVRLPCAHTFHSSCMLPWLPTHPCCPCCRFSIFS